MVVPEGQPQPPRHRRTPTEPPPPPSRTPLRVLLRVASVACGIQFGWALQLSLLTPYVQELGIPHVWSSIIWLCGPLSGFFVQPLAGHMSDRSTSKYGRRRPFIVIGCASIILSVLLIGFAADIGGFLGDGEKKTRAIVVFVIGFWFLDMANNATQGPCRALLADLTGKDHRRTRVANAYYSLFMAVGNILGYATGAYSAWYKVLPFTLNASCDINCANLKSAFLIDVIFIIFTTYISVTAIHEQPITSIHDAINQESSHPQEAFFWEMFGTFKYLPRPVWLILFATSLTWIGWFPFTLFDTDWMGREIYGGDPNGDQKYSDGVRMGAFGLLLNSVILGITSLFMENLCRRFGSGFIWGISNFIMFICFLAMLLLSFVASNTDYGSDGVPNGIVIAALVIFAILGMPLAVTYSVPYALVASRIESLGLGQGLSMGVLNVSIVLPQIVVSLGSGPWDELFGSGNSPSFAIAAAASFASGLVTILAIPRSRPEKPKTRQ
ncbi:sucrose transport protein SUC4-like [Bidens hawaiensis]|uniref:sucrose transport protein SUC4-like n=1 Tax=Bidens hawaiensis TaxID=980011 RepID=UPI00404A1D46